MRHAYNLLVAFSCCFLFACETDPYSGFDQRAEDNIQYKIMNPNAGDRIVPGDFIKYHVDFLSPEGEVLETTRKSGQQMELVYPEPEMQGQLLSFLNLMTSGDSMIVVLPVDSMEQSVIKEQYPDGGDALVSVKVYSIEKAAEREALNAEILSKIKENYTLSESGQFYYKIPDRQGKNVAAEGDQITFFDTYTRNNIQVATSFGGQPAGVVLDERKLDAVPFFRSFYLVGEGDSLQIAVPVDSLGIVPPGYQRGEMMLIDFRIVSITRKADLIASYEAIKAKAEDAARIELQTVTNIGYYEEGKLKNLKRTTDGVNYVIHKKGKGRKPKAGDQLTVDYAGYLMDSTRFDESLTRESFTFNVGEGQVIEGWDKTLLELPEGTEATLFIPSRLGYGDQGAPPLIPAQADLTFYVNVRKVKSNK